MIVSQTYLEAENKINIFNHSIDLLMSNLEDLLEVMCDIESQINDDITLLEYFSKVVTKSYLGFVVVEDELKVLEVAIREVFKNTRVAGKENVIPKSLITTYMNLEDAKNAIKLVREYFIEKNKEGFNKYNINFLGIEVNNVSNTEEKNS